MDNYRRFVKDIGLVGIAQILTNIRGFILLPILTKTLGAAEYGIWAQISVTLNFLMPFTALGLPNALIRFLPASKETADTREQIWSSAFLSLGVSALTGVALVAFAKPLDALLHIPFPFMVFLASLIAIQSLNSISSGIIQAFQEAKKLSAFIVLSPLAEILFVSAALALGKGLYGAVASLMLAKLVIFVLLILLIVQKVGFQIPAFKRTKEYLHFGIPLLLESVSYRIVQVGDQYMIGAFLGILFVGYYAPAYSLGLILNMVTLPVGMLLPALLAKFFSENNIAEVKTYLANILKYLMLILIPATAGLSVLSKQVLEIFSTKEIALHAWQVVPFIAVSFLLFATQGVFVQILYLFKKTRTAGMIWFLGAIINLGTNLIFIPKFGIFGAAITTLFAYFFVFAATWFFSIKYLSFNIDWSSIFKSIIASFVMSMGIFLLHPEGSAKTAIAIVAGIFIYGIVLVLIRGFGKKEKDFLARLWA